MNTPNTRLLFLAAAAVMIGLSQIPVAAINIPVAVGPLWNDTGNEVPMRFVFGTNRAATGREDPPMVAHFNQEWVTIPIPNITFISDVKNISGTVVLVADDQRILTLAAPNWVERYVLDEPSEMFLVDSRRFRIVVDDGVLSSFDGGLSWQKESAPNWRPRAIASGILNASPTDGRSIVVGDGGEVFESLDGLFWSRIFIGTDENLVAVASLFDGFVVVSETGRVFTTTSSLIEWVDHGQRLPAGVVKVSGDQPLFAITEEGRLFTSANGSHWSERLLPAGEEAVAVYDAPRSRPLLATRSGRLLQGHHALPFLSTFSEQDGIDQWSVRVTYASSPYEWLRNGEPTGVEVANFDATEDGEYSVLMSDPESEILTDFLSLRVQENFDQWRNRIFSPAEVENPEISGPEADPLGTGRSNLLRFAVADLPDVAGDLQPTVISVRESEDLDGTRFGFVYFRSKKVGGIEYIPEVSADLKEWIPLTSSGSVWVEEVDDLERVTVVLPDAIDVKTHSFFRLVVRKID